ncbi:hypothetical protein [Promicromonospora xylanilytica]
MSSLDRSVCIAVSTEGSDFWILVARSGNAEDALDTEMFGPTVEH